MHYTDRVYTVSSMLLMALVCQKVIMPVITHTVKPDGSVLVAGSVIATGTEKQTIGIARFKNMIRDNEFGLKIPDDNNDPNATIAFDPDNNLVLVEITSDPKTKKLITQIKRYKQDGQPDTTFGTNGISQAQATMYPQFIKIEFYQDKKFVIATDNSLMQYNSNGTLDSGFNTTGILMFQRPIRIVGIAIDRKNNIIVASENAPQKIVRYTKTGAIDTSFNSKFENKLSIDTIYVEPSGDIIVMSLDQTSEKQHITRLKNSGEIDTQFTVTGNYIPLQIFSAQGSDKKSYVGVRGEKSLYFYDAISKTQIMKYPFQANDAFVSGGLLSISNQNQFALQSLPAIDQKPVVQPTPPVQQDAGKGDTEEPNGLVNALDSLAEALEDLADAQHLHK